MKDYPNSKFLYFEPKDETYLYLNKSRGYDNITDIILDYELQWYNKEHKTTSYDTPIIFGKIENNNKIYSNGLKTIYNINSKNDLINKIIALTKSIYDVDIKKEQIQDFVEF